MDPYDKLSSVKTKKDFMEFLLTLETNFQQNNSEWENITIPHYLESIAAWLDTYTFDLICKDETKVDWKLIAEIFYIGKIYE